MIGIISSGLLAVTLLPPAATADPGGVPAPQANAAALAERGRSALAETRALLAGRSDRRTAPAGGFTHGREATGLLRDIRLALPHLRGADRAAAARLLARPTDAGGDDLGSYIFELESTERDCSTSARFCIHYTQTGQHAASPARVATVAKTLDHVHATLVGKLGYRAPLGDAEHASSLDLGNPNGQFDIFLGNVGAIGAYGYCATDPGKPSSYCVLDNDFAEFPLGQIKSLRVTAAHEYFHAIQFAYDAGEDLWLMEGSAVWAEERVYGSINDYLQYVHDDSVITNSAIPVDQDSIYNLRVYSSMLFFEHMTQTLGLPAMRQVWEAAQGAPYSLQAVRKVVSSRTSWPAFINRYAVWNSRPPGVGYREAGTYPAGRYVRNSTLGMRTTRKSGRIAVRRDHLASAAIRYLPARASTTTQRLRITIDGPATSRGAVAAVQVRRPKQKATWSHVKLNAAGDGSVIVPFGRGQVQAIVLTVANASTTMTNCWEYGDVSYSCGGQGVHKDLWATSAVVIR